MWEDAVKVAKEHCAHLMVAVLGKEEDLLEKGKLFAKVVAACCRQENATGIYTSGVVFEPRFYEGFADMMRDDELPIFNWIWFGLWRDENGMNGYTYGMDVFGKDEMEVLGTNAKPSDLRDFFGPVLLPMCWRMMWNSMTGRPLVLRQMISTPSPAALASACRRSR